MSPEPVRPAHLSPARPGETTCTTDDCARAGAAVAPPRCPDCGNRVHLVPSEEPAAAAAPRWATPVPAGVQPAPGAVRPAPGAAEVLSRTIFGGFWAVVTVGLVLAALAGVAAGHPQALVALLAAMLTGLYARYIFRGGRFRIMFW